MYTKRQFIAVIIGLSLMLGMLMVQFGGWRLMGELPSRFELLAFDTRLQWSKGPSAANDQARIVIVDIDERSLREQGRWPWSRTKVADLAERLAAAGAAVIAFDVIFAEPEANPVREVAEALKGQGEDALHLAGQLAQFEDGFDRDRRLAEVIAGKEVVLGYMFFPGAGNHTGMLPQPLPLANPQVLSNSSLYPMAGYNANLPVLTEAALGGGFFSLEPDPDGVCRRAPLVVLHDNQLYGSLALEALRQFLLADSFSLVTIPAKGTEIVEALKIDGYGSIPLDAQGRMIIPFLGRQGSFPYISATDVLSGKVQAEVEGAIVLVGTTAPGLFDLRATPVQAVFPGVEVHANLIDGILAKRFFEHPAWTREMDFTVALLAGLLMAFVVPVLTPLRQILWSLALTAGVVTINLHYWKEGLVLSLAMPLLMTAMLAIFSLGYGFLVESRSRRHLKEMFGHYVPPQIVQEMSENPKAYGFEGETRELTVLFADIRGFTTLSESMSAGDLKKLLNRFFTPMTRVIFETRGTIDKYVGDMIMAFWGAPVQDREHAVHAIEAAFRMLEETEKLKKEFRAEGLPEVNIGVGLNSGPMNVGDMGSEYRRAYTVLGDAVNLGSRLEGTTKYYGVGLVVGETTKALAEGNFIFRDLDLVRVKGKTKAIHVYEPVCRTDMFGGAVRMELELYHESLADFRCQRWEKARAGFERLREAHPERRIYPLYLERIATLISGPPCENWEGVYDRKEK